MIWETPDRFGWLEQLEALEVTQDDGSEEPTIAIHPLPVVLDLSPFIVGSDNITLQQLEIGNYIVPVNLPEACQKALWHEFGKSEPDMTYLRITLGYNQGDSPGDSFVLEIWPSRHCSPKHDHGNACAVIKVPSYYDSLRNPSLINSAALKKGDITWPGPQNYQIHMLHNKSPGVCCTIQRYRHPDQDHVHYEGFDYAGDDNQVHEFVPNSDMAFLDFRKQMMDE
ncbi:hypothetical protein BJ170DRAFT_689256 [Xylariales sp. AK1849]|nr:hypothetical protein BJ170DRAFT_689256 [Xylariales sp. AK1849]